MSLLVELLLGDRERFFSMQLFETALLKNQNLCERVWQFFAPSVRYCLSIFGLFIDN